MPLPRLPLATVTMLAVISASASPFAYITNIDTSQTRVVTVIDLGNDSVEATLYAGGAWANAVAVNPEGTVVYVGTQGGDLLPYAVNENMHLALAGVSFSGVPGTIATPPAAGVAVHPESNTVYVTLASTRYLAVAPAANLSAYELVELPYDNPKFVAVTESGDAVYVVHAGGELSVADLVYDAADDIYRPDPASVAGRGQVVAQPGGIAVFGSWLLVTDAAQDRLKLLYLPGSGTQTYSIADVPIGVVGRFENNSARFHVTQTDADQVFTVGGFPAIATGSQPRGIGFGRDQNVLVVANYASDSVSILRPTPVAITDSSLNGPDAVAVGPLLPPGAEPRHRSLGFVYKDCLQALVAEATVKNKGPGFLRFKKAVVKGPDGKAFQIAGDTCSDRVISPDASCSIKVKFTPIKDAGVKGVYTGSVAVATNDLKLETYELALRATPYKLACGQ